VLDAVVGDPLSGLDRAVVVTHRHVGRFGACPVDATDRLALFAFLDKAYSSRVSPRILKIWLRVSPRRRRTGDGCDPTSSSTFPASDGSRTSG
jgi:hypothetical protein